jgi:hypothetical protein
LFLAEKMKIPVLYLFFLLPIMRLNAQVYNYEPVRYSNVETNPAYLASDKYRYSASALHKGGFFGKNKFLFDQVKLTAYNRRLFTGAGLILNRTQLNDSISYSYAGVGIAYRNTLFNAVRIRIGLMYKFSRVHATPGSFDYYSFTASSMEKPLISAVHNFNAAVSFSSPKDRYFLSFSRLNINVPGSSSQAVLFPTYYMLCAGDLAKMLEKINAELYYTCLVRQYKERTQYAITHFINALNLFNLSRESVLRYGLRAGYCDQGYLQFTPMLSWYKKVGRWKFMDMQLLYDFSVPLKNSERIFRPSLQLSTTYMF